MSIYFRALSPSVLSLTIHRDNLVTLIVNSNASLLRASHLQVFLGVSNNSACGLESHYVFGDHCTITILCQVQACVGTAGQAEKFQHSSVGACGPALSAISPSWKHWRSPQPAHLPDRPACCDTAPSRGHNCLSSLRSSGAEPRIGLRSRPVQLTQATDAPSSALGISSPRMDAL